jgi:Tol biopolymer transport system component
MLRLYVKAGLALCAVLAALLLAARGIGGQDSDGPIIFGYSDTRAYLMLLDARTGVALSDVIGPNSGMILNRAADGTVAVHLGVGQADLHLWTSTTQDTLVIARGGVTQLRWSADGRLAFVGNNTINIWNGRGVQNTDTDGYNDAYSDNPAWSADGRLSYVHKTAQAYADVYVWQDANTPPINISQSTEATERFPTWSADGRLAYISATNNGSQQIFVWSGIAGQAPINITDNTVDNISPTWSADGRLAYVSVDLGFQTLYVWDGVQAVPISHQDVVATAPLWGPDGRLAFVGVRRHQADVYVWSGGVGEAPINVAQAVSPNSEPTWSAGGNLAWLAPHNSGWALWVWDGQRSRIVRELQHSITPLLWDISTQDRH